MTNAQRQQKILALTKFLQGERRPLQQFKPQLVLDLDQLSGDELETLQRLQQKEAESGKDEITLEQLETLFGRKLTLIPKPSDWA